MSRFCSVLIMARTEKYDLFGFDSNSCNRTAGGMTIYRMRTGTRETFATSPYDN